jgi:hypothetical protein
MLLSMTMSVGFIIVDILSVTSVISSGLPEGVNPFWKLAFVFKCFTDTIILDDFKTALDKLKKYRMDRIGSTNGGGSELNERPIISPRRPTLYTPYNESRGVTSDEGPKRDTLDMIDVEMQYWESAHSTQSTARTMGHGDEV